MQVFSRRFLYIPFNHNTRKMTTGNHMETATVSSLASLSDTVKQIVVTVEHPISFKAGQWVDVHIPGIKELGGFSIVSAPHEYESSKLIKLAVKNTEHPPGKYFHTECKEDDQFKIQVGGDFYFDPCPKDMPNLLLIAGGVGINPIVSILSHFYNLLSMNPTSMRKATLLYSAKNKSELIFSDVINDMTKKSENIDCQFYSTSQPVQSPLKGDRIGFDDISRALEALGIESTHAYICGPPDMIDDFVPFLSQGRLATNVHYEKWW